MYNPCNSDFFKHPERTGETTDIEEVLKIVYTKLYENSSRVGTGKLRTYSKFEEQEFFQKVIERFSNQKPLDCEKAKCSEVFADYICKVAKQTCPLFLERIVVFVTLFRECLNSLNKKEGVGNYTEENNAEDAPDISNEFVTEYLEADIDFFDFQKEEVIDITQNFCQWLYDNNFTCSKLSLISSL